MGSFCIVWQVSEHESFARAGHNCQFFEKTLSLCSAPEGSNLMNSKAFKRLKVFAGIQKVFLHFDEKRFSFFTRKIKSKSLDLQIHQLQSKRERELCIVLSEWPHCQTDFQKNVQLLVRCSEVFKTKSCSVELEFCDTFTSNIEFPTWRLLGVYCNVSIFSWLVLMDVFNALWKWQRKLQMKQVHWKEMTYKITVILFSKILNYTKLSIFFWSFNFIFLFLFNINRKQPIKSWLWILDLSSNDT